MAAEPAMSGEPCGPGRQSMRANLSGSLEENTETTSRWSAAEHVHPEVGSGNSAGQVDEVRWMHTMTRGGSREIEQ